MAFQSDAQKRENVDNPTDDVQVGTSVNPDNPDDVNSQPPAYGGANDQARVQPSDNPDAETVRGAPAPSSTLDVTPESVDRPAPKRESLTDRDVHRIVNEQGEDFPWKVWRADGDWHASNAETNEYYRSSDPDHMADYIGLPH